MIRINSKITLAISLSVFFLGGCLSDNDDTTIVEIDDVIELITESCAWQGPYVKENPITNIAYPDAGALYWSLKGVLPEGATLRLKGKYPQARYFSLNSYKMDGTIMPYHAIKDSDIEPDADQPANPYLQGNSRDLDSYYTIGFLPVRDTDDSNALDGLAENVVGLAIHDSNLYPEPEAGWAFPTFSTQENGFELLYRLYLPDEGVDNLGEGGLPQLELDYNGETYVDQDEICSVLNVTDTTVEVPLIPVASYLGLKALGGVPYGDTPVNTRFFGGAPYYYDTYDAETYDKTDPASVTGFTLKAPSEKRSIVFRASFPLVDILPCAFLGMCEREKINIPGLYSNKDNSYVSTWLTSDLGDVVVFKGKLPITPSTINGAKVTDNDGTQLKYWSMCQNEFYSQRVVDCVYDEQVLIDDNRDYVIVTSKADNRPANATKECGYNWIEYPELGDNLSMQHDTTKLTGQVNNENDAFVILRNMSPEPDFTQSTQNIDSFRAEKAVMGDYLPEGEYMSVDDFESLACRIVNE